MSRATEDANRRLLRARDAMDRAYAEPLDIAALARIAYVSEAHFIRSFRADLRRDAAPLPAAPAGGAGDVPAALDRPQRHRHLPGAGFTSLGTFSRTFRAIVGEPPSAYRSRGPLHAVPSCFAMAWARPSSHRAERSQFRRSASPGPAASVADMITSLGITQIFVLDQDQALDFYVGTLGLELVDDVDFGVMRWLTVRVPGEDRQILLERPDPPRYDPATTEAIREMVTKGASGGHLSSTPTTRTPRTPTSRPRGSSCREEPTEQGYGIDFGFRDPFGNHLRIAQRHAASA